MPMHVPRGPTLSKIVHEISKSLDFADFEISPKISGFLKISRFHLKFQDFRRDFELSTKISRFQFIVSWPQVKCETRFHCTLGWGSFSIHELELKKMLSQDYRILKVSLFCSPTAWPHMRRCSSYAVMQSTSTMQSSLGYNISSCEAPHQFHKTHYKNPRWVSWLIDHIIGYTTWSARALALNIWVWPCLLGHAHRLTPPPMNKKMKIYGLKIWKVG